LAAETSAALTCYEDRAVCPTIDLTLRYTATRRDQFDVTRPRTRFIGSLTMMVRQPAR